MSGFLCINETLWGKRNILFIRRFINNLVLILMTIIISTMPNKAQIPQARSWMPNARPSRVMILKFSCERHKYIGN